MTVEGQVYSNEQTEPAQKDAYYLAISGWQKAVRRSDMDTAMKMLGVVLRVFDDLGMKSNFYKRVYVTLYEDIEFGDVAVLREVGNRLSGCTPKEIYNSGKMLVWITEKFVNARKCHDGTTSQTIIQKEAKTQEPDAFEERRMQDAYDKNDKLMFGAAAWRLYLQDKDRFWEVLRSFVPADLHDLVELGKKAWGRGSEYAWGSTLLAAFPLPCDPVVRQSSFESRIYRGFPGYAIDIHTGLGKRAAGIVSKKIGMDYESFKYVMWYNEGELIQPAVTDARTVWTDQPTPTSVQIWNDATEILHNAREFMMTKAYRGVDV